MRRAVSGMLASIGGAAAMPLAPASDGASWIAPAAACGYGLYRGMDGVCHRNSGYVHTQSHPGRQTCFWNVGKYVCR